MATPLPTRLPKQVESNNSYKTWELFGVTKEVIIDQSEEYKYGDGYKVDVKVEPEEKQLQELNEILDGYIEK